MHFVRIEPEHDLSGGHTAVEDYAGQSSAHKNVREDCRYFSDYFVIGESQVVAETRLMALLLVEHGWPWDEWLLPASQLNLQVLAGTNCSLWLQGHSPEMAHPGAPLAR